MSVCAMLLTGCLGEMMVLVSPGVQQWDVLIRQRVHQFVQILLEQTPWMVWLLAWFWSQTPSTAFCSRSMALLLSPDNVATDQ